MADRAGAIQEWCVEARRREPGQRAKWLIRAKAHRRLAPGATPRYVWAEMPQTCALGTLARARYPERPPRAATLAVTATPVTCHGARRPGGKLPPVTVSAVYVQASSSPPGETPIEWLRLTSVPVTDFPRACTVGQWSRGRWEIARFFRGLKQGGQIAPWRMQTAQRGLHALTLYLIVREFGLTIQ
jgi:hypothetical protein